MNKSLFLYEIENIAIERIIKFSKICDALGYIPVVGFSGGKDSCVVYDLVKRAGIKHKVNFRHAFESTTTLNFIREYYPEVVFERLCSDGWIDNISRNHNSLLPTCNIAYCCNDYKHNKDAVDYNGASIVGVRRAESIKRRERSVFEAKNKAMLKKSNANYYFSDRCTGVGTSTNIQLKPIVDWLDDEVWEYIHKYNLPINPEYANKSRVGCMICPKASFSSNVKTLYKYPKLIDAIILARERRKDIDWIISRLKEDYADRKAEYVCLWLNHSFRKLEGKNKREFEKFIKFYKKIKR